MQHKNIQDESYIGALRTHDANSHCSSSSLTGNNNRTRETISAHIHEEQIAERSTLRCIFSSLSLRVFLLLIVLVLLIRRGLKTKKTPRGWKSNPRKR
jgi:hypothetical protein